MTTARRICTTAYVTLGSLVFLAIETAGGRFP